MLCFPQAGDGWGAEASGDWGAEESWESVDGNPSEYQSLLALTRTLAFIMHRLGMLIMDSFIIVS